MGHLPLGLPWFVTQIGPMQEDNRWLCREPCTLNVFRPGKGVLYCSPEALLPRGRADSLAFASLLWLKP